MMIYQFSTHSIQNIECYETDTFSWVISTTLEIIVDFSNGRMLTVEGFFPLIKAKKRKISIPPPQKTGFFFNQKIIERVEKNMVYSLERRFPAYKELFSIENLYFDKESGIIMNGIDCKDCDHYFVSDNVSVVANKKGELCCLYIRPDMYIE